MVNDITIKPIKPWPNAKAKAILCETLTFQVQWKERQLHNSRHILQISATMTKRSSSHRSAWSLHLERKQENTVSATTNIPEIHPHWINIRVIKSHYWSIIILPLSTLLYKVCTVSISPGYTSPTSTVPKSRRNSSPTLRWMHNFPKVSKTLVENWIKYKPLSFKEMFNVKAVPETSSYVLIRLSIFVF